MMQRNRKIFLYIIIFISIFSCFAAVITSSFANIALISRDYKEYDGAVVAIRDSGLSVFHNQDVVLWNLKPFEKVSYVITVPDDFKDGDILMFRKSFSKFDLFLDNELIYSYYKAAPESGRPQYGGGAYFYIPLPDGAQGRAIRIDAIEQAEEPGLNLSSIYFGDGASLAFYSVTDSRSAVVLSVLFLIISTIGIIATIYVREKETKRSLLSLSTLMIILFMWILSQSRGRQYVISNPVLPTAMSFFCIYFFPVVLYKFCRYNYPLSDNKKGYFFLWASYLFMGAYIVIGALSLLGIISFNECLTESTAAIVFYIVAFVCFIIYQYFVKKEKLGSLIIMLSVLGFSFIVEFILLLHGISLKNTLTLAAVSIAAIIAIFRGLSLYLFSTKDRQQKEAIIAFAYRDGLTGLRNRQNYESVINAPFHETRHADIFVFDVNRLKAINDKLGHEKGNELLRDVASVIISAFPLFRQKGYRTGGDEFVVISPASLTGDADALIDKMKKNLRGKYGQDVVAIGHVKIDTRHVSIKDGVKMADLKMYEDKKNIEKEDFQY